LENNYKLEKLNNFDTEKNHNLNISFAEISKKINEKNKKSIENNYNLK